MLRRLLLFLSNSSRLKRFITGWGPSRRMAQRFVAGDELDQALAAARSLNQGGFSVTLDHLGENVANPDQADRAAQDYIEVLEAIESNGIGSGISMKLTQLGLTLDIEDCIERVLMIGSRARALNTFVRIDMEQSDVVGETMQVLLAVSDNGLQNVGAVIQSYLYRSPQDTRALLERGIPIRLVKGAYDEPPEVAYVNKEQVDQAFDQLTSLIIDRALELGAAPVSQDGRIPPITAIATHDDLRIDYAIKGAEKLGLPRSALEFQFLYGIRTELQRSVLAQGYPVRIYVPYGTEWFPYFMRRLAERPANLWFFLSNLFRR